eukprot:Partr_v1_DN27636_c0_g1_i2_m65048
MGRQRILAHRYRDLINDVAFLIQQKLIRNLNRLKLWLVFVAGNRAVLDSVHNISICQVQTPTQFIHHSQVHIINRHLTIIERRQRPQITGQIHREPGIPLNISNSSTTYRIHDKHGRNQITSLRTDMRGNGEEALVDLLEQGGNVVLIERQPPTQHDKQNHATTPDIHLWPSIQLARNDFGRGIIRRSTTSLEKVPVGHQIGQAKVGQLDVPIPVQQNILGLQVPMHDIMTMTEIHGRYYLLKQPTRVPLGHLAILNNQIEELTPGILHDHDDLGRCSQDLISCKNMSAPTSVGSNGDTI